MVLLMQWQSTHYPSPPGWVATWRSRGPAARSAAWAKRSCEQLGKEVALVACQMILCAAGNMNSSPPPSSSVGYGALLFSLTCLCVWAWGSFRVFSLQPLHFYPFTLPLWCHEVLKCKEELRVDLSLRRLQWRHEWVQMVLLHLHQYFKYFFTVFWCYK